MDPGKRIYARLVRLAGCGPGVTERSLALTNGEPTQTTSEPRVEGEVGFRLWTTWTESGGGIITQRKLLPENRGIGCWSTKNDSFINHSHPIQYLHPTLQHPLYLNRSNKWLSTFYLEQTFHEHALGAKHLDKIALSSQLHFINEL